MIISKTPLRISFIGGSTDLPSFFEREYGAVLSSTIDKYVYVIIKERFDDMIVLNWSKKETVDDPDDIEHDLIREAMKKVGIEKCVEITTIADIPSEGSGLGSSSSLTVGLLNAFYAFKGMQVSTERLAKEACEIEIDIVGKPIGKQDQYAAAYGGVNEIIFYKGGRVEVSPVRFPNDKLRVLGSNLLLLFTGITRKSDPILQKQNENIDLNIKELQEMRDQVPILKNHLEKEENDTLGPLLNMSWEKKKSFLSGISNQKIDNMYETALKNGATGGKICGAGGGGFLLLYVPREKQNSIREAFKEYRELPFMLEKYGSRIIFSQMSDYWR
jgi:D-glycero-alpha-D-manno-heptose-7-phosphate kinase